MRKYLRFALITAGLIVAAPCVLGSQTAHAQVLQPKTAIKDIISHFRAEMASLIAHAGAEARASLVVAFQLSESLISALGATYQDAMTKTFDELDEQQQKAFQDTDKALAELKKKLDAGGKEALGVAQTFNAVIADIASWSKKPVIISYTPRYVGPAKLQDTLKIDVAGVRLHAADAPPPKLTIGGQKFEGTATDVSLSFSVPRSAFETRTKGTAFQPGTITLYRKSDSWLSSKPIEVNFGVMMTVLPENLGTFSVRGIATEDRKERKLKVSTPPISAVGGGWGPYSAYECVSPDKDFVFDLDTVSLKIDTFEGRKHRNTSPSINIGGIAIKDGVKTEKLICFTVVARTGCNECYARTAGHLEASMVRPYKEQVLIPRSPPRAITWNSDIDLPLVPTAISQVIEITLFDEITRVLALTSPDTLDFVKIDADTRNRTAFIRPLRPW